MIQNPALAHLIAWNPSGKVFSVPNPNEFSRAVLPQYFKHNNFQSFVRQLNMYGFHKSVSCTSLGCLQNAKRTSAGRTSCTRNRPRTELRSRQTHREYGSSSTLRSSGTGPTCCARSSARLRRATRQVRRTRLAAAAAAAA